MTIGILSSPRIPIPPKGYGGTERIVYFLIKGLQELGHKVILFGPEDSEIDCEIISPGASIPYAKTVDEENEYQKRTTEYLEKTIQQVKNNLKRLDIIHCHEPLFDLSDFKDFPNLTTIHNPFSMGFNTQPFIDRKDTIFYNTISYNQQKPIPFLRYIGAIYNGLDPEEFPIIKEPEDYVCFIGRLDPAKQPHLAIYFAIRNNIKIKVAGNSNFSNQDYFNKELKHLFDHPLVEYIGEVGMKDKVKLISHAKCNLHPIQFREPFGLTVVEAAYCGTPTIAVSRGSMPEIIEDGKTGILVEDYDEATYMLEMALKLDRDYVAKRTRKLFNYKIMSKEYVLAYQNILNIFKENPMLEEEKLKKELKLSSEKIKDLRSSIIDN